MGRFGVSLIQLVLRDIKSGKRSTERVRAAEDVELVDLKGSTTKFLGVEGKSGHPEPYDPTQDNPKISKTFLFEDADGETLKVDETILPVPQKYFLNRASLSSPLLLLALFSDL